MGQSISHSRLPSSLTACTLLLATLSLAGPAMSQQIPLAEQTWSAEVIRPRGQPVVPLFDGWFPNDDGTRTLCFGYFNLNTEQSLDIPLGELNHLSHSEFNALLPTHFEPLPPRFRRRFCAFSVTVEEDFGRDDTILWTLTSAGQTLEVPGHIKPAYVLDEPASDGRGDLAPLVRLSPDGAGVRGRRGVHSTAKIETRVDETLILKAWIEHPDEQVWVGWSQHSGPGNVDFDFAQSEVFVAQSPAAVSARFDTPGDYVVRMQTIDDTSAFEFYCCHSNAYFHITVNDQENPRSQ